MSKHFYKTDREQLLYLWAQLETAERIVYGLSFDGSRKIKAAVLEVKKAIAIAQNEVQNSLQESA
jgi:hypothetical protein